MSVTPIETPYGPIPLPLPHTGPAGRVPFPHISNPLPRIARGAEYVWDDVYKSSTGLAREVFGGISSLWSGEAEKALSLTDLVLSVSQTYWSSFVSQLEDWIAVGIDEVGGALVQVQHAGRAVDIELANMIESLGDAVLDGLSGLITDYIRRIASLKGWTEGAIDNLRVDVEAWVIDDIASPLLREIATESTRINARVDHVVDGLTDTINDAVHSEALRRAAAVAGVAAAVATVTTWIDDCGAPMCAEFGPGTNLGSLLGNAELQLLLAALLALSLKEPEALADAAVLLGRTLGPVLEATVTDWLAPLESWTAAI